MEENVSSSKNHLSLLPIPKCTCIALNNEEGNNIRAGRRNFFNPNNGFGLGGAITICLCYGFNYSYVVVL